VNLFLLLQLAFLNARLQFPQVFLQPLLVALPNGPVLLFASLTPPRTEASILTSVQIQSAGSRKWQGVENKKKNWCRGPDYTVRTLQFWVSLAG